MLGVNGYKVYDLGVIAVKGYRGLYGFMITGLKGLVFILIIY